MIFQAYRENRIADTMIRQKLRDIRDGCFRGKREADGTFTTYAYSLADLEWRYFRRPRAKGAETWRLRYSELDEIPIAQWPEDARQYAIDDAVGTREVYEAQGAPIADEHAQTCHAWWLALVGARGMALDPARVGLLERDVRAELAELRAALAFGGLLHTDGTRDTKAAKARMIEVCATPILTEKGAISLSEEACTNSGDPDLAYYAQFAAVQNVLSKDLAHMTGATVIHGKFDSLVASGRTACRGFNLQNMRTDGETRRAFRPRNGYCYCVIDLDSAELRAVAQVCIAMGFESTLAKALNDGRDVHCMLAAEILGQPYEKVLEGKRMGDPDILEVRNKQAKRANFGLWGGMMPIRFQATLRKEHVNLPLATVEHLRTAWLRTWPEAGQYLDYFRRACMGQSIQISQLYSGRLRGGVGYCDGANTMFQGLIADAAKAAGWALCCVMYDDRDSVLYGSHIVNFPHDEFVCEVPHATAHECAIEIQRIVLAEVGRYLPNVPPRAEPCITAVWDKRAKPVYENGRLVPWSIT
jgi:hypothetical protein